MRSLTIRFAGIAVAAVIGLVAYQCVAADQPLWNKTLGDLTEPTAVKAKASELPSPGSVNIEFVVDGCQVDAGQLTTLSGTGPLIPALRLKPNPAPEGPTVVMPAPVPQELLFVAPDSVLPSLKELREPRPLQSRAAIVISPSILYLP